MRSSTMRDPRLCAAVLAIIPLLVTALVLSFTLVAPDSSSRTAPATSLPTVEVTPTPEREPRASRSAPRATPTPKPSKPSSPRDYARSKVSAGQWSCLDELWRRESSWSATAVGPLNDDGRYPVGIPQLKGLKPTDGALYQVDRGLAYIEHRYGTPCAALAHSNRKGWY